MICSTTLFLVGNRYFSLSICLVLVIPRCPRSCSALITVLWRLVGMTILLVRKILPVPVSILTDSSRSRSSLRFSPLISMTTPRFVKITCLTTFSTASLPVIGNGCLQVKWIGLVFPRFVNELEVNILHSHNLFLYAGRKLDAFFVEQ